MRYIRVQWLHSRHEAPVKMYSELDDQRWEVRKVEIFPDGRVGLAGPNGSTEATVLGEEPVPSLEEIGLDPEFRPEEISPAEFEAVWDSAQQACRVDAARDR